MTEPISTVLSAYAGMVFWLLPVMGTLSFHALNIIANFVLPGSSVNRELYSWSAPWRMEPGLIQPLVYIVETE